MCKLIAIWIKDWLLTEKRGCDAYVEAFRRVAIPPG